MHFKYFKKRKTSTECKILILKNILIKKNPVYEFNVNNGFVAINP
jgi:hypothetical protein